jgi:phosphoglycolate phosphatase
MASINNIKLICFDLDGTLVDSVPDLRLALNAMLDQFQLPHCQDREIKKWVGNGLPKLVERALKYVGKTDVDQPFFVAALNLFEQHYQHYLNSASCLYEGVVETLQVLKERGYKIALITNKAEQFLADLLAGFEIADHFDLLLGGDTLAKNKPDPMQVDYACKHFAVSKTQTVMVGDSLNDILAGQNANVRTIAVTYGYNYGKSVATLNPDFIINQFNELLELL